MSLLLDALNKADQERKRNQATPGINSNHGSIGEPGPRKLSLAVVMAVLIGFAVLLTAIYWLGKRSNESVPTTPAVSSTPAMRVSPQPIITNTQPSQANLTSGTAPSTTIVEEDVAHLYEQSTQTLESAVPAIPESITAPNADNQTLSTLAPNATPISITQFANLPDLHDLPSQILVKIPSLNYSEHNYNDVGGSVKINGEIKRANDQLAPGLVIDKILEDGMILHLDNYSFKMRALNSWVNM